MKASATWRGQAGADGVENDPRPPAAAMHRGRKPSSASPATAFGRSARPPLRKMSHNDNGPGNGRRPLKGPGKGRASASTPGGSMTVVGPSSSSSGRPTNRADLEAVAAVEEAFEAPDGSYVPMEKNGQPGGGGSTLHDLAFEDKRKVAKLIRQVVDHVEARKTLEADLAEARAEAARERAAREASEASAADSLDEITSLRAKLGNAFALIRSYQRKIRGGAQAEGVDPRVLTVAGAKTHASQDLRDAAGSPAPSQALPHGSTHDPEQLCTTSPFSEATTPAIQRAAEVAAEEELMQMALDAEVGETGMNEDKELKAADPGAPCALEGSDQAPTEEERGSKTTAMPTCGAGDILPPPLRCRTSPPKVREEVAIEVEKNWEDVEEEEEEADPRTILEKPETTAEEPGGANQTSDKRMGALVAAAPIASPAPGAKEEESDQRDASIEEEPRTPDVVDPAADVEVTAAPPTPLPFGLSPGSARDFRWLSKIHSGNFAPAPKARASGGANPGSGSAAPPSSLRPSRMAVSSVGANVAAVMTAAGARAGMAVNTPAQGSPSPAPATSRSVTESSVTSTSLVLSPSPSPEGDKSATSTSASSSSRDDEDHDAGAVDPEPLLPGEVVEGVSADSTEGSADVPATAHEPSSGTASAAVDLDPVRAAVAAGVAAAAAAAAGHQTAPLPPPSPATMSSGKKRVLRYDPSVGTAGAFYFGDASFSATSAGNISFHDEVSGEGDTEGEEEEDDRHSDTTAAEPDVVHGESASEAGDCASDPIEVNAAETRRTTGSASTPHELIEDIAVQNSYAEGWKDEGSSPDPMAASSPRLSDPAAVDSVAAVIDPGASVEGCPPKEDGGTATFEDVDYEAASFMMVLPSSPGMSNWIMHDGAKVSVKESMRAIAATASARVTATSEGGRETSGVPTASTLALESTKTGGSGDSILPRAPNFVAQEAEAAPGMVNGPSPASMTAAAACAAAGPIIQPISNYISSAPVTPVRAFDDCLPPSTTNHPVPLEAAGDAVAEAGPHGVTLVGEGMAGRLDKAEAGMSAALGNLERAWNDAEGGASRIVVDTPPEGYGRSMGIYTGAQSLGDHTHSLTFNRPPVQPPRDLQEGGGKPLVEAPAFKFSGLGVGSETGIRGSRGSLGGPSPADLAIGRRLVDSADAAAMATLLLESEHGADGASTRDAKGNHRTRMTDTKDAEEEEGSSSCSFDPSLFDLVEQVEAMGDLRACPRGTGAAKPGRGSGGGRGLGGHSLLGRGGRGAKKAPLAMVLNRGSFLAGVRVQKSLPVTSRPAWHVDYKS